MRTNDPPSLLARLLRERGESEWLEYKRNNCDPAEIGRSVSACANTAMLVERDRAFIIFGIEDATKRKVGTTVRLRSLKKGGENFYNWLSRMLTPRIMIELLDFEDDGKAFSVLAVEPTYDRPVQFSGTEYIRIGENVKLLRDHPEHAKSLWLATSRRRFESAVALPHQTARAVLSLLDSDCYYRLSEEEKPARNAELIRRFVARGFLLDDMEGGFDITNLGALLFARDLTKFPSVANKSVRLVRYLGRDKKRSEQEIEGKKGYAVGFQGLLSYVKGVLPKEEEIRAGLRRTVSHYSEVALREIIANALIHQDFTISGISPVIEIYDDRVEIINPGYSLIERDRIIDERRSRNEKLAAAMRELHICEERGGGIDKAIIDIEEMFLPAPEFIASEDSMRVVLFGPKRFSDLTKSERVWACFCHCVVRWLRHDYMGNASLRERFGLTSEQYQLASNVIAEARAAGRIVPADPVQGNRNAKYLPYWAREEDDGYDYDRE